MPTRVLLVDDHRIIREGLRMCLAKHDDMEVVGDAADGRTAVRMAKDLKPDVVVMDVAMPDLNGLEATRQICQILLDVKVLALSMHADARRVSEMLKAGAAGYLLKDCAFEDLVEAIRTVLRGDTYLAPSVANVVVFNYIHETGADEPSAFAVLTPREREVLQLMAEGYGTKEIAMGLHVSVKTVETHRKHVMDKLDVHNVADLTKYALRQGLTSLDG